MPVIDSNAAAPGVTTTSWRRCRSPASSSPTSRRTAATASSSWPATRSASRNPIERQVRLWEDVARLATALHAELAPARINFACLGNFMAHVHWHVIPRYADDPEPLHPIWVRPLAERRLELPASERDDLIGRLRRRLA